MATTNYISKIYLTWFMNIAITKMSSKGQIVIPREMREDIEEGEEFLIIKSEDQLILKKASALDKQLEEDLEVARRTEAALQEYEKSGRKGMTKEAFLKELDTW